MSAEDQAAQILANQATINKKLDQILAALTARTIPETCPRCEVDDPVAICAGCSAVLNPRK